MKQSLQDQNLFELENHPVGSLMWRYFWPAFIGVMANSLYNIIDRIFIGQYVGAEALSGITAVFPVMVIMMAFGMLIGIGGSVRLSLNLGRKDYDRARLVVGNVVVLVIVVSAFVTILGFGIKDPMLRMFGATDTTIRYANDYLNFILWGVVLHEFGFSLNALIRAEGNARIAMYSMLISAGVNIPLD
ncbi:MAG: MATE family efflux transporter, partial [Bacteroidota bacterium]